MSTDQLQPAAHHPLGPSNFPMWAECAAYDSMPDVDEEDIGIEDDTPKGRGRVKHHAAAMLLAGDLDMRQRALDGLSDAERAEVQFCVERVLAIVEEHGYTREDIRVEQRVTMFEGDGFKTLYFGTGDAEAGPLAFDFKFGEARNYFPQMAGYDLPRMIAREEKRRLDFVIYGRLKRVERYVIDRQTAEVVVYGILTRRTVRKPTPCQYCGWCANRATCSALVAAPIELANARHDWTLKLPTPHVSQIHDPVWMGAARLLWKKYIEPWGKAVDFASSSMAGFGNVVPLGYKKIPVAGSAEITDTKKALELLAREIPEEALWPTVSITFGALVKAVQESRSMSEDKAKAFLLTILTEAKLVKFSDARFMLRALPGAEETIRAALARPALSSVVDLPEKGNDLGASSAVTPEDRPQP